MTLHQSFVFAALVASFPTAFAADVTVQVTDMNGQPLKDAVVYVQGESLNQASAPKKADIEQKGKKFNPLVSVVQAGSSVSFPNNDSVRHHVYSFSPIKKFELKLYSGVPANPVVFDKAGTAVLGCNIHDAMLAYVHVVDTAYFAKTDGAGLATILHVPDGQHQLNVWHYALKKEHAVHTQAFTSADAKKPEAPKPEAPKVVIKLDINPSLLVK